MKKILICASALAFAFSCSENNELYSPAEEAGAKGITFESGMEVFPETKADLEYKNNLYNFFWYAEQDEIAIYGRNVYKAGVWAGNNETWSATPVTAMYKATQSKANGVFTASNTGDILDFNRAWDGAAVPGSPTAAANGVASFFAVYPNTVTISAVSADSVFTLGGLPALATQDQLVGSSANGVVQNMFMASYTASEPVKSYDAVGEKINLSFARAYTAAVFSTKGYDQYTDAFGKLKTITLEAKGNATAPAIAPSNIIYDATDATVDYSAKTKKFLNYTTGTTPASLATLTFAGGAGTEWKDEYKGYMALANIDRATPGFTATKKEKMEIVYTFENINFTVEVETNANWPATPGSNAFVGVPALDINSYPYLVTNVSGVNDRTLIVNKGAFSDIYKDAATGNVRWDGADVPVSEFKTIISNVALTTAELAKLKEFTNVTEITLAVNTTIPSKTFETVLPLTKIDLAKATSFADDVFGATVPTLQEVYLPAYKFTENVNDKLLTAANLVKLDMSAVTVMGNVFPSSGFVLTGFGNLTDVKVGSALQLGSGAFKNCTALVNVTGGTLTLRGASVFEGCTVLTQVGNDKGKVTVKLNDGLLPDYAFKNCINLTDVIDGVTGKTIAPVTVGAGAFQNTKIKNIALKTATTIGSEAFSGCSLLEGTDDYTVDGVTKKVLWVSAEHISESAFAGCEALVYVYFQNATTIDNTILNVSPVAKLREVKFDKVFTSTVAENTTSNLTFGNNAAAVVLYVASGQTGVQGNVLTLNKNTTPANSQVTFSSIER